MALVSLKSTSDEAECEAQSDDMGRQYGWGTRLSLDEKQTAALGITTPPAYGTVVNIQARAVVVRTSIEEDGEGPEVYMTLQLTDMEMTGTSQKDAATLLYSGDAD